MHYLRKNLVGRTIRTCEAFEDDIVYGKVGCTAQAFRSSVQGKKVLGADQQGKYFYMTFDKPPHAVMHFGMTGWMKFDNEDTHYYKQAKEKDGTEAEEWPPKYAKFLLKCDAEGGKEAVQAAFVDARRLARIRLVECDADNIRNESPLKENGPDPVRDKDIVTVDWLGTLLRKKRVPVKALLLDQGNLSGVGNWVADEVLYQARVHPEQYSNTFDDEQVRQLHDALIDVCTLAVETLADSKQFPENWLMKYRWDKGKKDANTLPNGEKIVHLKVGGRTSAIVPSVQKKTAATAGDVDAKGENEEEEEKPAKGRKRKVKAEDEDETPAKGRKRKTKAEDADGVDDDEVDSKPAPKRGGRGTRAAETRTLKADDVEPEVTGGAEQDDGLDGKVEAKTTPAKSKGKKAASRQAGKSPTPGSRRSARTRAK